MVAQVAVERGDVEAVALHDGHGPGIDRHAASVGLARAERQSAHPTERNGISCVFRWGRATGVARPQRKTRLVADAGAVLWRVDARLEGRDLGSRSGGADVDLRRW